MPKPEPGLIRGYLDGLAARLPASVVEERAVAALGRRYRLATATGVAGCFGYAALIAVAIFVLAPVSWVTAAAITASATRIAVTARALRPALAR